MKKHGLFTIFNEVVEIISINGGWTTYKNADGDEKKARNSHITAMTPAEVAEHAAKHPNAKSITSTLESTGKAEKPAKAIKPKRKTGKVESSGEEITINEALVQPDYTRYTKHEVKSPSGRKALDINDAAAALLRGHDISDCYFIVAKNMAKLNPELSADTVEKELTAQYEHLNIGMQRMNLGNRLRKAMGIYGNLNAHKTARAAKPKAAKPAKVKSA